jgi:hypothetical protein
MSIPLSLAEALRGRVVAVAAAVLLGGGLAAGADRPAPPAAGASANAGTAASF